jgi:hypothetical protein
MGLSVIDAVTLNNGLELKNLYFCIGHHMVYVQKLNHFYCEECLAYGCECKPKYKYHCNFEIYKDYDCRKTSKQHIEIMHIETIVEQPSEPYVVMYDEIKKRYNNTADC